MFFPIRSVEPPSTFYFFHMIGVLVYYLFICFLAYFLQRTQVMEGFVLDVYKLYPY